MLLVTSFSFILDPVRSGSYVDFVALAGSSSSGGDNKLLRKLGLPCRGADTSSPGLQWSRDGRWLIEISSSNSSSGWNAATRRRVSGDALLNGGGGGWRGSIEEGGTFFEAGGGTKAVVASGGSAGDGLWVAALHQSGHVSAHGSSSTSTSTSTSAGSLLLARDIGARGDGSGDVVACGGGGAGLYTLR
jgi:hypothetical protein